MAAQARRHTGTGHRFLHSPPRDRVPLPPERQAALPWLVAGDVLITPWPARRGDLTRAEADAIAAVRNRLAARPADADAFWLDPRDGRVTPMTIHNEAWLRVKLSQNLAVRLTD